MEIQNRLRAMSVKRWNMVETTRPQSLAEHSFNVAMLAGEIAKFLPSIPVQTVYRVALEHDLEEVIIGDIPTPTKARFAKAGLNYPKAARRVFTPDYQPEANVGLVVKVADKMEAIWFLSMFGACDHAKIIHAKMSDDYVKFIETQHHLLKTAAYEVTDLLYNGALTL